jgi:hypothetical protein
LKPVENDLVAFRLDVALQAETSSSPAENAIMANAGQALARLGTENFESRPQEMYGVLDKGEAEQRDPYMAKIGFDGKENRLGGEEKRGGIDFTRINMIIQPQLHSLKTNFKLPERQLLQRIDIETENNELRNLMHAGILPSSQRLIEYITAYYLRNAGRGKIDNAVGCIVDYFKLEEENCDNTDEIVKNFLVLIESGQIN